MGFALRSPPAAIAGAVILVGGYALIAALPRVSPFHVVHCIGSSCFSGLNPAYPLLFVATVAGTAVLFFGLFGRAFVLSPVFVASMVALEYGLAATTSSLLSGQDPLVFSPLVAIGFAGLGFNAYRRLRRSVATPGEGPSISR